MLSFRSFARAAPRIVSRLVAPALQKPFLSSVLLQSAWTAARNQTAALSISMVHRSKGAEGDSELIAKIRSEIQLEKELQDDTNIPTSVKDYIENGPFEVIDTPGEEDVTLTRTFGEEKIRVTFSIADINEIDPEADYEDRAMADEQDGEPENQKDRLEDENSEEEQEERSFAARLNIVVEKPAKGALVVEAMIQEGMVVIDNVFYYSDPAHAHAKSPEKIHERQAMYAGPPFGNLDEDLQVLMERYLDERGINTSLAIFVPDYMDMKEQREYVRWLVNVKGFIEA